METDLLQRGVELMLVGMGTVFVFLTALVTATTAMSRLVIRRMPAPQITETAPSDEEIAAIASAISQHRRR